MLTQNSFSKFISKVKNKFNIYNHINLVVIKTQQHFQKNKLYELKVRLGYCLLESYG